MRALLAALALLAASCTPHQTLTARAPALDARLPTLAGLGTGQVAPPARSNGQIAQDFLDLTFEMESGRPVPVLTRFEGPITVRVTGPAPATLQRDLDALLTRLQREAGLPIARSDSAEASITVEAVPSATLRRAVPRAACFVMPGVQSWAEFTRLRRSPALDWSRLTERRQAAIFVPADAAPQELRDCLHEELAQALGPLNDLYRLPDSVFNDDNIHAVLTGFDMLILRVHYAPELSNGMRRQEVAARLPGVLARLNPAGEAGGAGTNGRTSRAWIEAIETALSAEAPGTRRRTAAAEAVRLSSAFGWHGAREGFSHYAEGRLLVGHDNTRARAAFLAADRAYASSSTTRIHLAHVAVQRAAFALQEGDGQAVLDLVRPAQPVARAHENAALVSTLMLFEAEALDLLGRPEAAARVRLDSLPWARYGFGSEADVRARQREISGLRPDVRT